MRFVWFLNFWGWSRESHRAGMLLRHPLEGIGSNWDEWLHSEATSAERTEIDLIGRSDASQRQFLEWLERVWIQDAVRHDNRLASLFIKTELARVAPFDRWETFATFRTAPTNGSLAALVLADESDGRAEDVRSLDALLLPINPLPAGRVIVTEGFQAESGGLNAARDAALTVLNGRGGLRLLLSWAATGRRPYSTPVKVLLSGGWLIVGLLIAWLWFGPDPGANLRLASAALAALWCALVSVALLVATTQIHAAWRAGTLAAGHLSHDQIRLRLPGRFTLKGGSAGLPFSLAILQALSRAYPNILGRSWIWRQFAHELEREDRSWAATGMMTADGQIKPVKLPGKLRACLRHSGVSDLLAPAQRDATLAALQSAAHALAEQPSAAQSAPSRLRIHRCRTLEGAVLTIARLPSKLQASTNALALVLSGVMICALPDLAGIVLPPPAPVVIAPSSPSPYFLWVSLDTRHPRFFQVVLESPVWANRRADVAPRRSLPASIRAEIQLVRLTESSVRDLQQGVVWIERRPCFLTRRFQPGEIVGRYTLNYLNRLHHE